MTGLEWMRGTLYDWSGMDEGTLYEWTGMDGGRRYMTGLGWMRET